MALVKPSNCCEYRHARLLIAEFVASGQSIPQPNSLPDMYAPSQDRVSPQTSTALLNCQRLIQVRCKLDSDNFDTASGVHVKASSVRPCERQL